MFDSYSTIEDLEDGASSREYIISEYLDGIKTKEYSITEVRYSEQMDDWKLLESQNEADEFNSILNNFWKVWERENR